MGTAFYRGQQLGRNDLNIFLVDANGTPVDAAEISYALFDVTLGSEVLVGGQKRNPSHPSLGEYFASVVVPLDANMGLYRVRWNFRETLAGPIQQVVQEFEVVDKVSPGQYVAAYTSSETDLIRRMRILLRDQNPARNYHFRPPRSSGSFGKTQN
jgi:hypothetical protein